MDSSSLIEAVRRHLGGGQAPEPGVLRRALAGRLADSRKRRGIRHELAPVVSVLVAGAACGHGSPLAIAQAAAGWDQELLAVHGCRISPPTGLRVPPSARTLYRIPQGLASSYVLAGRAMWTMTDLPSWWCRKLASGGWPGDSGR